MTNTHITCSLFGPTTACTAMRISPPTGPGQTGRWPRASFSVTSATTFTDQGSTASRSMQQMVGTPNPRMVAMIDVEAAGGATSGDQSANVNSQYDRLAKWLGDPRRVIGYGNVGDLNSLWPTKPPGIRLVIADYGANPDYPGKFAHQFSDNAPPPPFGPSDLNSADG